MLHYKYTVREGAKTIGLSQYQDGILSLYNNTIMAQCHYVTSLCHNAKMSLCQGIMSQCHNVIGQLEILKVAVGFPISALVF